MCLVAIYAGFCSDLKSFIVVLDFLSEIYSRNGVLQWFCRDLQWVGRAVCSGLVEISSGFIGIYGGFIGIHEGFCVIYVLCYFLFVNIFNDGLICSCGGFVRIYGGFHLSDAQAHCTPSAITLDEWSENQNHRFCKDL